MSTYQKMSCPVKKDSSMTLFYSFFFQMIFFVNVGKPNEKSGIMEDFALLRFTILA